MTELAHPRRSRFGLAQIHRWLAIALSPVLALILLSGIVLAFRPILGDDQPSVRATRVPVDAARLVSVIDSLDPKGTAVAFGIDDRGVLYLGGPRAAFPPHYINTGKVAPAPVDHPTTTFWEIARRLHAQLWIGAEGIVVLATLAMIFLVVAGPFLSRPHRPRNARSWHVWMGWSLWPLLALLPFSVVMMKIHPPAGSIGGGPTIPPARVIERARAAGVDPATIRGGQALPGGNALVMVEGKDGFERLLLRDGRVSPFDGRVSQLGHALHEGTWAGPWSGLLNIVAALASLAMLGSGLLSWARRRGRVIRRDEDLARAA